MKIKWVVCAVMGACITGCVNPSGLAVKHAPNPCDIHDAENPEGRVFPYMWFYRTEVRNTTDYPIRITQFEGLFYEDAQWKPANILNRKLTSEDFSQWYAQGDPTTNGWIQPHATVACDPNWHGVTSPVSPRCKWVYDGVDSRGRKYRSEAEIISIPVKK